MESEAGFEIIGRDAVEAKPLEAVFHNCLCVQTHRHKVSLFFQTPVPETAAPPPPPTRIGRIASSVFYFESRSVLFYSHSATAEIVEIEDEDADTCTKRKACNDDDDDAFQAKRSI